MCKRSRLGGSYLRASRRAWFVVVAVAAANWVTAGEAVAGEPPTSQIAPAVTGVVRDGAMLTASSGVWQGTQPLRFEYQWQACLADGVSCTDLDYETLPTIVLRPQDVDRRIRVEVSAANEFGSASALSPISEATAALPPINEVEPEVIGDAAVGATVSVSNGVWAGSVPFVFEYQWERCFAGGVLCLPIAGASDPSYRVGIGDLAQTLRVRVGARNSAGVLGAVSAPTGLVGSAVPGDDEPASPSPSTEELVEAARTFRGQFGLNDDPAYIRSLDADASLQDSRDRYGVSLARGEQRSIEARQRWTSATNVIQSYAQLSASDSYAGRYIDQREGGLIYVGFTDDAERHMSALADVFPFPEKLRVFRARYTLAQLESVQRRVHSDAESLGAAVGDIVADDIDVVSNVVEVAVPNPSEGAQEVLRERYGAAVTLVEGEPTQKLSRRSFQDMKAGLRIVRETPSYRAGPNCTAGFVGTAQSTQSLQRSDAIIVAGHCSLTWADFRSHPAGVYHNLNEEWYQGRRKFGETATYRNSYRDQGIGRRQNSDAIPIHVDRDHDRLIYISDEISLQVDDYQRDPAMNERGDVVCASLGVTGSARCGVTVRTKRRDPPGPPDGAPRRHVYNQHVALFRCRPGDSGSPVYDPTGDFRATAIGVVIARTRVRGMPACVYSHIEFVRRDTTFIPDT